jgi:hypothetical protein
VEWHRLLRLATPRRARRRSSSSLSLWGGFPTARAPRRMARTMGFETRGRRSTLPSGICASNQASGRRRQGPFAAPFPVPITILRIQNERGVRPNDSTAPYRRCDAGGWVPHGHGAAPHAAGVGGRWDSGRHGCCLGSRPSPAQSFRVTTVESPVIISNLRAFAMYQKELNCLDESRSLTGTHACALQSIAYPS